MLIDRVFKRKSRIKIVNNENGKNYYPYHKEWSAWSTHTFHQKECDENLEKSKEDFKKEMEKEIERFTRDAVEYRWNLSKIIKQELVLKIDYQDSEITDVFEGSE